MLPRVALRSTNHAQLGLHCRSNGFSPVAIRILNARRLASGSKPPRAPPPPPPSSRPPKPPPAQSYPGASGQARQTSPGASIPKNQTARSKDAAKSGGPVSAAAVGPKGPAKPAVSPVEGVRPDDRLSRRESLLQGNAQQPQEPIAQKFDADQPVPGSIRDVAQEKVAASENTPPPPESQSQPLPDLRQGIPSTFDIEFGADKARQSGKQETQEEKLDLNSEPAEEGRQHERGERDYDRSAYETSLDRRRARMLNYFYVSVLFLSMTGAFYIARPYSPSDDVPAGLEPENATGWSPGKMYARMRARWGSQVAHYTEPAFPKLLPELPESQRPPFTLVVSLEDLMIHTTWDTKHGYRVAKRPGLDYFIRYLSSYYELVLFTNTPIAIADPVLRKLDPHHMMWPLGREATKYEKGEYIKDLSYLNRPLSKTLIIDTHAAAVQKQPENAIVLPAWDGDAKGAHVNDLIALIPFLEYVATMGVEDVRPVLKSFAGTAIPEEFARREAEARRRFLEERQSEQARRPRFSLGALAGALGMKAPGSGSGGAAAAGEAGAGLSMAQGYEQGKMLSDQIREQGQLQYEALEKQIREHGDEWLKQEEEDTKRQMEAQMKDMKKGALSWFSPGGSGGSDQK